MHFAHDNALRKGAPLLERFSDLVDRHSRDFPAARNRALVRCIFHSDKTPSLSIDRERGIFHCFGCGVGGGVRDFACLVGEEWSSTRSESSGAKARRIALTTAREAYRSWQRQQFNELVEQYHLLQVEREIATIAYRAIHRNPGSYSEAERSSWTHTLASILDCLAVLEHDLDILTYREHEEARFRWWQEEGCRDRAL